MRCVSTRVLPEPGPGEDEQRPLPVRDRLALRRVEVGEQALGGVRAGAATAGAAVLSSSRARSSASAG